MPDMHTCKNCGAVFSGKYCNQCGEKIYHEHDKKVSHLFEELFHFITHFEGSFFNTIKTVVTSPGKLSLDYCQGIRKKYFKPVSLFMLLVVLYLLFPRFKGLNMQLGTYAAEQYGFTWTAIPVIKKKMQQDQLNFQQVSEKYQKKSGTVSKAGLFLLIPLSALVLFLLFIIRRRYLFDHFVAAVELCCFFIATHFLLLPFISYIAELINPAWMSFFEDGNEWLGYLQLVIDVLFVSFLFRKFYGEAWYWVIPKAIIYVYVFGEYILYVFRLLVFWITMLFV
jgi:hypothetical protein